MLGGLGFSWLFLDLDVFVVRKWLLMLDWMVVLAGRVVFQGAFVVVVVDEGGVCSCGLGSA